MKRLALKFTLLVTALAAVITFTKNDAQMADDFLGDVARGNMAEIAVSQTAIERSQNESVRQYAQMMVTDHTAAANQLQTLAASKSYTLPTAMDAKHQSALTKLQTRSGADFDREYMKTMVDDHGKMLNLLQKQASKGTDADFKALAAQMVPVVQGHLTAARTLLDSLSGKSDNNSTNSGNTRNSNNNRSTNSNRRSNQNGSTNGNSNGNINRP